ncbi:MAG TPA: glycosyltransferase family 2 protein [Kiritimatiellia bacterium]|nr:glycosyltransferase family 2 protein [Kiritimatiellia bacterium]HSA19004.1 glycosyltransferase family 2 protein [Kiritimatiellia bacterium]
MAEDNSRRMEPPGPRVHIITLNWENEPVTARLLAALRELRYPNRETVVVDNGSADGSADRLAAAFPEAVILRAGRNLGFGAGNNLAIRRALEAGADYVWLINNDARPAPDALDALARAAEAAPRAGAVGAAIYHEDRPNALQAWGGGTVARWLGWARLATRPGAPVEYITGTSMLLRCAALREAGLFDERFFLYWEDAELCARLRRAGWEMAVAGEAKVWHASSATTGRDAELRMFHITRSLALYLGARSRAPGVESLVATLFQAAGKLVRGNRAAARGAWLGRRAGLEELRAARAPGRS